MDLLSKSDPFCVVYYRDTKTGVWSEMGRTETIMDNLNPDFTKQFVMDYFFARRDSAEDFCRLKAPRCTAVAWIFIPAYCFAIP